MWVEFGEVDTQALVVLTSGERNNTSVKKRREREEALLEQDAENEKGERM